MLKKLTTPTNNTFSGVEFILRGAVIKIVESIDPRKSNRGFFVRKK